MSKRKDRLKVGIHIGGILVGTFAGTLVRAGLAELVPVPEQTFDQAIRELGLFGVGLATQKVVSEAVVANYEETLETLDEGIKRAKAMSKNI